MPRGPRSRRAQAALRPRCCGHDPRSPAQPTLAPRSCGHARPARPWCCGHARAARPRCCGHACPARPRCSGRFRAGRPAPRTLGTLAGAGAVASVPDVQAREPWASRRDPRRSSMGTIIRCTIESKRRRAWRRAMDGLAGRSEVGGSRPKAPQPDNCPDLQRVGAAPMPPADSTMPILDWQGGGHRIPTSPACHLRPQARRCGQGATAAQAPPRLRRPPTAPGRHSRPQAPPTAPGTPDPRPSPTTCRTDRSDLTSATAPRRPRWLDSPM